MNAIKSIGEQNGWAQNDYANALKSLIAEERKLLESGNRRLNKNARPYAK
jgi:hypothetical protein